MRHEALLTADEIVILKGLVGQPMKRLTGEVFGHEQFRVVYLYVSEDTIVVFGGCEEEASTPEYSGAEVGRVWVDRFTEEERQKKYGKCAMEVFGSDLGVVRSISRARTVISFNYARREKTRTTASGEVKPAGSIYGYSPVFHHPERATEMQGHLVDTDLGVLLETSTDQCIFIYNENGNSIYVAIRLDGTLPEELVGNLEFIQLART